MEAKVIYKKVKSLPDTGAKIPVDLTQKTMKEHKEKVLAGIRERHLDAAVIYADREHGGSFKYLTGFEPRFEESLLILHGSGEAYLLLGNESLKMAEYSRISAEVIHAPQLSLPNQPMETVFPWQELLEQAGIRVGMRIGIAGWKLFDGELEKEELFDVPYFIVYAVKHIVKEKGKIQNITELLIHPEYGARIRVNANEAAHYEFGASLAGRAVYQAMEVMDEGMSELEVGEYLSACGQPQSVQPIFAAGERFTNGVAAPRNKKIQIGDRISITMGLKGGLTSRSGYAVSKKEELSFGEREYLGEVAVPYFKAMSTWYKEMKIGLCAGELYEKVEHLLPKERYGWNLNPGHYVSDEEWLSSPFYKDSKIKLKSGMMLQADIIIRVPGFGGANAEDGILLADEELRREIEVTYPDMWRRICVRKEYMKKELGILLHEEVLPMSGLCGYYNPYLLKKGYAFSMN